MTERRKTIAFIQARTSSNRFPGKVLADLNGMPMILYMARRVARAGMVDAVIVLTSEDASDDELAGTVAAAGFECFRGPLDDVLGRFTLAAARYPADIYVRLTGDCPLADPAIIDSVVVSLIQKNVDYAANVAPPTFADGLDVEAFTAAALDKADRAAISLEHREHVTLWMRDPDAAITSHNHASIIDSSHLRLTVDYPDDLAVVRKIVESLSPTEEYFDHFDMLRYLQANSDISSQNVHIRNEALNRRD